MAVLSNPLPSFIASNSAQSVGQIGKTECLETLKVSSPLIRLNP